MLNYLINRELEECLDEHFPKGHKSRGKALVLFAKAHLEIRKAEKKARQEGAKSALSLTNAEINIIGKAVAEYWDIHAESPEEDICISAMKKLGFQHVTNDEDSIFYEKELKQNE